MELQPTGKASGVRGSTMRGVDVGLKTMGMGGLFAAQGSSEKMTRKGGLFLRSLFF